jgi:hypothetical protein
MVKYKGSVMKVIGWKAFYESGAVYTSKRTKWPDMPEDGFICFMKYFDEKATNGQHYREITHGRDFYFCADGEEPMPDNPAPSDYIYGYVKVEDPELARMDTMRRYKNASIKRGKFIQDHKLKKIIDRAMEDHEL